MSFTFSPSTELEEALGMLEKIAGAIEGGRSPSEFKLQRSSAVLVA